MKEAIVVFKDGNWRESSLKDAKIDESNTNWLVTIPTAELLTLEDAGSALASAIKGGIEIGLKEYKKIVEELKK